jgi:hypothetical protein
MKLSLMRGTLIGAAALGHPAVIGALAYAR